VLPPCRRAAAVPGRAAGAGPPPSRPAAALARAPAVRRPALLEGSGRGLLALRAQHLELVYDLVEMQPPPPTTLIAWRTPNGIDRTKMLVFQVQTVRHLTIDLLRQSLVSRSEKNKKGKEERVKEGKGRAAGAWCPARYETRGLHCFVSLSPGHLPKPRSGPVPGSKGS